MSPPPGEILCQHGGIPGAEGGGPRARRAAPQSVEFSIMATDYSPEYKARIITRMVPPLDEPECVVAVDAMLDEVP